MQVRGDLESSEWEALLEQAEQQYDVQPTYRLLRKNRELLVDYVPKGQATEPTLPKRRIRKSITKLPQLSATGNESSRHRNNESFEKASSPNSSDDEFDSPGEGGFHRTNRPGHIDGINEERYPSPIAVGQNRLNYSRISHDRGAHACAESLVADHMNVECGNVHDCTSSDPYGNAMGTSEVTHATHEFNSSAVKSEGIPESSRLPVSTRNSANQGETEDAAPEDNSFADPYEDEDPCNEESYPSVNVRKRHLSTSPHASPKINQNRINTSRSQGFLVHSSDSNEDQQPPNGHDPSQNENCIDNEPQVASRRFVPKMDPNDPLFFQKYANWVKSRKNATIQSSEPGQVHTQQSAHETSKYKVAEHIQKHYSCLALCGRPDSAESMINCETPGHETHWYHLSCAGVAKEPAEDEPWFCPDCTNTAPNSSLHPVFSRHPTSAILPSDNAFNENEASFRGIKERGLRSWTTPWSVDEEQKILDIMQGLIDAHEKEQASADNEAVRDINSSSDVERSPWPEITGRFRNLDALFTYLSDELWRLHGIERTRSSLRSRWDGASGLRNRAEAAAAAEDRAVARALGITGSASGGVRLAGSIPQGQAPAFRMIRGIRDLDWRVKQLLQSKGIKGAGPGQRRERRKVGSWGKDWVGQDDRGTARGGKGKAKGKGKGKEKAQRRVRMIVESDEDEEEHGMMDVTSVKDVMELNDEEDNGGGEADFEDEDLVADRDNSKNAVVIKEEEDAAM
ncbi:MAG: hypothetical protein M1821_003527 [Bathelium mastoideum]|nr:MAG: hypothetical protein M1821_003527 [Bathelium mastoideum]